MTELRYDGRVVVITGAGQGLGRSHALAFARRGAKVVVNDLGGSRGGDGASHSAADAVVAEIRAAGGEAIANHDSVEDGDRIAKSALDAFGRLDVLVNNAGILRDVSFAKMTDDDWTKIDRVHLYGAFKTTHAAWPVMREQKYGRVVFTSSAAGLYGNFGQSNYSAAKLGLVGLANTLAVEGKKNGVLVHAIAPVAASRMTDQLLPEPVLAALQPGYVSELLAWLCHERCTETGDVYEVGGGYYGKVRWERSEGVTYRLGRAIDAETLERDFGAITSFERATHPAHIGDSLAPILTNVERGPSKGRNEFIDVDEALGFEYPTEKTSYDEKDLALYALGVGAARDPLDAKELRYVYELHGEGFAALPSYGVIPAINLFFGWAKQGKTAKGLHYGFDRVLHGEQSLELFAPLPPRQTLTHRARVSAIYDKGSPDGKKGGAVVVTTIESADERGRPLLKNEVTTFVRGAGGFGGDRGPSVEENAPPDRAPDVIAEEPTSENQALLYRLSGDWNPLHADPGFAQAFGFARPILHGLCTFGFATRAVIKHFAKDRDPRWFRGIKVRFADPVLPGETLVTEMWQVTPTRVVFRVRSKERDKVVVSHAAVTFFESLPKPASESAPIAPTEPAKASSGSAKASSGSAKASEGAGGTATAGGAVPTSADIFQGIAAFLAKHPETAQKVKTVYAFELSSPTSRHLIDLSSSPPRVVPGSDAAAQCTLALTDADFMAMVSGKVDAMKLFTTGKLAITGDLMASQKLDFLRKVDPADVMRAMEARTGRVAEGTPVAASTAPTESAAPSPTAPPSTEHAPALVRSIEARLSSRPAESGSVLLVVGADAWRIDLAARTVTPSRERADTTLTTTDAAIPRWRDAFATGYQRGHVRLDGDVALARRVVDLFRS